MVTIEKPPSLSDDPIYRSKEQITVESPTPEDDTLPKNFLLRVRELGDKVAMRKKRCGIWQEYTWKDSYQHVHDFCLGLISLGLQRGETVAVIGENDPEFYWSEIAVWSAGGRTTAIFTDASLQELGYVVTNADAVFVIAHDQEQCDKALALRESGKTPDVRKVIYWDDRGMWSRPSPKGTARTSPCTAIPPARPACPKVQ
jgi:long-chain acyl-CoA synthetase